MKIKIGSSNAYHQAMLTIAHLVNKGENCLTPPEYKKLIALCRAAEKYEQGSVVNDNAILEEQTTASSFTSSLYYSLFEFAGAFTRNYQDKTVKAKRFVTRWAKFIQFAELASHRAK